MATTSRRPSLAPRMEAISPFRVVEVMEQAWAVEREGRSVIHLVAGEPDWGTPLPVVEAATRAIADGDVHYTPALGRPELREAISRYYAERYGADVPATRVVVTTGASAALLLAFGATMAPGEEVLLADPGYPCNRNLLPLFGAAARSLPVGPEARYQLSAALVEGAWDDATGGVLVASPANPTGTVVEADELAAIVAATTERGGTAFVDEVYGELVYGRTPATVLGDTDDAFVVSSFSKTFGMTGWRLGWLVCPEGALGAVTMLAQNMYISPPTPSQAAGVAAFQPEVWALVEERRQEFEHRRDLLVGGLRRIGFGVPLLPEGAFYVYAQCDAFSDDSTELVGRLLREAGVAVAPGNDFGTHRADQHVRVSYTASTAAIEEALERLERYLV